LTQIVIIYNFLNIVKNNVRIALTGINYSEYIAENTDGQYFIPITFPDDEDAEE